MMSDNTVQLRGRLGQDAVLKTIREDLQVVNFSIATTEFYKTETGDRKEHVEWHEVYKFGKNLTKFASYLKKGTKVVIEGSLRSNVWEKEGVSIKSWKVKMNDLRFESTPVGKTVGGESAAQGGDDKQTAPKQAQAGGDKSDDLPF